MKNNIENEVTDDAELNISLKTSKKINVLLSVISMAFAAFTYFYLIPEYVGTSNTSGLSPDFFPKVYALLIFFVALFQLILILFKKSSTEIDGGLEVWPWLRRKRVFFAIVFVLVYVFFLIELLGYFVATPIVLMISFFLLGERSLLKIIIVTMIFTIIVYTGFEVLLNIYLPKGTVW